MKKMILDCDAGIHDALAIAYAIGHEKVDLIGVTASYGVSCVENTYRNAKHTLKVLQSPIDVWMGSEKPISGVLFTPKEIGCSYYGDDGIGGLLGKYKNGDIVGAKEDEAIDFMIDNIHRYQKDLTLVTTGPLTNLAKIIRRDASLKDHIGQVVCTVGAFAAPGNVNFYAETNAYLDPEAAKIVFESSLPLTIIGLDVTRKISLKESDLKRWQSFSTAKSKFCTQIMEKYLENNDSHHPRYTLPCPLLDPLAVAAALYPSWFTKIPMHVTCATTKEAKGRTHEDLTQLENDSYTTDVAFDLNRNEIKSDFFETIENLFNS